MPATPFSYRQYGTVGASSFAVPFPYLLRAHVKVYLGYNLLAGTFTSELVDGVGFTWTSGTQISTTVPLTTGQVLTVIRQTPSDTRLVDWNDGSKLTADDLDTADLQNLYVVQELGDRNDLFTSQQNANVLLKDGSVAMTANFNAGSNRIINLAAPAADTDAVNRGYVNTIVASGIGDGDKGDIVVSGSGSVFAIDAGAIVDADVNASAAIAASKLAFTQAGTGAVARTVDSKLKDVVSVKDFGAVGDGVADDRSSISQALSANANCSIPSGTYNLATNLSIPAGNRSLTCAADAGFTTGLLDATNMVTAIGPSPNHVANGFFRDIDSSWDPYYHYVGYSSVLKGSTPNVVSVALYSNSHVAVAGHQGFGLNVGTYVTAAGKGVACELDSHVTDPNGDGYALLLDSIGSYPSRAAIVIQNNNAPATFDVGISFNNANGTGTITPGGPAIKMNAGSCGKFIDAELCTFTAAEVSLPSLEVAATPANINSKLQIYGSNSGSPGISAIGAATNIGMLFTNKGTGDISFIGNSGTSFKFKVKGAANTTDFTEVEGGNGGSYVKCNGSSANAQLILQGKGNSGVNLLDGAGASKLKVTTSGVGFFATAEASKQTVSGSRGGNAALASLLTALAAYGLITDSTTA